MNNDKYWTKSVELLSDLGNWYKDGKLVRKVKVCELFDRHNDWMGTKRMALVFYLDKRFKDSTEEKGIFRYLEYGKELDIIIGESEYKGSKYDLMHKYGGEYYVEDENYNFVNYNGIKF